MWIISQLISHTLLLMDCEIRPSSLVTKVKEKGKTTDEASKSTVRCLS